jgi:hypothetical protein
MFQASLTGETDLSLFVKCQSGHDPNDHANIDPFGGQGDKISTKHHELNVAVAKNVTVIQAATLQKVRHEVRMKVN